MKNIYSNVIRPIGLNKPCATIESVCNDAEKYRRAERLPGPFMIELDEGDGRGVLSSYFEDMFTQHDVIPFTGIDHGIRLKFTDSLKPFEIHDEAAIYDSYYSGLEFHVLTDKFADTCYENNIAGAYIAKTVEASRHATIVVYVPRIPGKSLERLIGSIRKELDFTVIKVVGYSVKELCGIVERVVTDSGTVIEAPDFNAVVSEIIMAKGIESASEASVLAKDIIFAADYSGYVPVVTNGTMARFRASGHQAVNHGDDNVCAIGSKIRNIRERV